MKVLLTLLALVFAGCQKTMPPTPSSSGIAADGGYHTFATYMAEIRLSKESPTNAEFGFTLREIKNGTVTIFVESTQETVVAKLDETFRKEEERKPSKAFGTNGLILKEINQKDDSIIVERRYAGIE